MRYRKVYEYVTKGDDGKKIHEYLKKLIHRHRSC